MQARQSVDLDAYPDLIMILLGFRVTRLRGLPALWRIGRGLRDIARDRPDGLLDHELFLFAPNHVGIRQYWRDLDSLETFTRAMPHVGWWRDFAKGGNGAGFWHESYSRTGAMEAVYVDMPQPVGFGRFAPPLDPTGPFLTARGRLTRTVV